MNRRETKGKPTFFWQGFLILLPVVALVIVSLASLQRDEQAAEQEAKGRATQNANGLARAIRSEVNDDLQRFLFTQNELMTELRDGSQHFPSEPLKADIAAWEHRFPELRMSDLATPRCTMLTDGREIEPREIPVVPVPPKWFRDLSPEQQVLWEALRSATIANLAPSEIKTRQKAFARSNPSEEAKEAALYLFRSPEQILSPARTLPLPTETGISFQDIACSRMLSATNAQLTDWLMNCLWQQAIESPSFLSPKLIELAAALTNRADAGVREKFIRIQQFWNTRSRAADCMDTLRRLPDLRPWKSLWWSHWTADDETLAIFRPMTFVNVGMDAEGVSLSGQGYEVWFAPRQVIAAIFERTLTDNNVLVPEYAAVALAVEGVPLHQLAAVAARDEKLLLASVDQKAGSSFAQDAIRFQLRFYLTSREQMLSAERQREIRFGWLIVLAAATALVGFFAARRAFYRQLRLNEMKSDFVSSVSHELRAPIASVRLMAEGLERGKISEPAKQHEYFKFIVQECRRLSSLIENVLDFSRIEEGRKRYEMESTDLVALTQQTVKVMETYAAERDISLALRVTGTAAPVDLDGKAMQQALVNLIDNAIKHSPKGSTIAVDLDFNHSPAAADTARDPQPSSVLLSVEDHGEGIAASEQDKIFERFYRIGSELRRETQGVGIGLSIVKHIVEAHGGTVTVRSAPGQGSRFTIQLPAGNGKRVCE